LPPAKSNQDATPERGAPTLFPIAAESSPEVQEAEQDYWALESGKCEFGLILKYI
jgi:hypothetical protein